MGMLPGPDRLKAWIERSKVNQREAAEILGAHPVVLSQWLSGQRTPGLANAVHIEQVTGVSVESWVLNAVSR
jgi:transcriptional regulator with XRE-family HTH domain